MYHLRGQRLASAKPLLPMQTLDTEFGRRALTLAGSYAQPHKGVGTIYHRNYRRWWWS